MLTFEQAYEFTSKIGSHTSFEKEECEAYFDTLQLLPRDATIVEIGLEYGRSSSIAMQVAKDKELRYTGIDPFDSTPVFRAWSEMANKIGAEYEILRYRSEYISQMIWGDEPIDMVFIDGDHDYEGVKTDCHEWLPKVIAGGYAAFHDYQRESLPDVTKAANEYMIKPAWAHVRTVGTLGIWRKR